MSPCEVRCRDGAGVCPPFPRHWAHAVLGAEHYTGQPSAFRAQCMDRCGAAQPQPRTQSRGPPLHGAPPATRKSHQEKRALWPSALGARWGGSALANQCAPRAGLGATPTGRQRQGDMMATLQQCDSNATATQRQRDSRAMATQRQHNGNTTATQWQRKGKAMAMQWQCDSHAMATQWQCNGNTKATQRQSNGNAMAMQQQRNSKATPMQWQHNGNATATQRQSNGNTPAAPSCRVVGNLPPLLSKASSTVGRLRHAFSAQISEVLAVPSVLSRDREEQALPVTLACHRHSPVSQVPPSWTCSASNPLSVPT